ncbi:MAG: BrnT family toxin [Candidatus Nitrotoga sp.]
MKFDWDEAKNKTNIRERGLDFVDACEMFSAPMLVLPDTRKDYGEVRYIGFGYTQGRLMVVIYTEREAIPFGLFLSERRIIMSKSILKKQSKTDWVKVDAAKDNRLNYAEIPEQGAAFFKSAVLRMPEPKSTVTMRMDKDVLEWFKAQGKGYQTRINVLLRAYMDSKKATH